MSPKPTKVASRDPETGQFVAQSGSEPDMTWDDLEQMQIEQTARVVDAGASVGYNRKLPDIDLQRSDTLSLASDEMAELVALRVDGLRGYIDDNQYGSNFNFRYGMSIAINYDDMGWIRDNDIETDNIGTSGEMAGRTRIEDSGRLLWFGVDSYISNTVSSSNGAGGSSWPNHHAAFFNYRHDFGQGPILDDDDSFTHGAFLRTVNVPNDASPVLLVDWTGFFDVFEVERPVRVRRD